MTVSRPNPNALLVVCGCELTAFTEAYNIHTTYTHLVPAEDDEMHTSGNPKIVVAENRRREKKNHLCSQSTSHVSPS